MSSKKENSNLGAPFIDMSKIVSTDAVNMIAASALPEGDSVVEAALKASELLPGSQTVTLVPTTSHDEPFYNTAASSSASQKTRLKGTFILEKCAKQDTSSIIFDSVMRKRISCGLESAYEEVPVTLDNSHVFCRVGIENAITEPSVKVSGASYAKTSRSLSLSVSDGVPESIGSSIVSSPRKECSIHSYTNTDLRNYFQTLKGVKNTPKSAFDGVLSDEEADSVSFAPVSDSEYKAVFSRSSSDIKRINDLIGSDSCVSVFLSTMGDNEFSLPTVSTDDTNGIFDARYLPDRSAVIGYETSNPDLRPDSIPKTVDAITEGGITDSRWLSLTRTSNLGGRYLDNSSSPYVVIENNIKQRDGLYLKLAEKESVSRLAFVGRQQIHQGGFVTPLLLNYFSENDISNIARCVIDSNYLNSKICQGLNYYHYIKQLPIPEGSASADMTSGISDSSFGGSGAYNLVEKNARICYEAGIENSLDTDDSINKEPRIKAITIAGFNNAQFTDVRLPNPYKHDYDSGKLVLNGLVYAYGTATSQVVTVLKSTDLSTKAANFEMLFRNNASILTSLMSKYRLKTWGRNELNYKKAVRYSDSELKEQGAPFVKRTPYQYSRSDADNKAVAELLSLKEILSRKNTKLNVVTTNNVDILDVPAAVTNYTQGKLNLFNRDGVWELKFVNSNTNVDRYELFDGLVRRIARRAQNVDQIKTRNSSDVSVAGQQIATFKRPNNFDLQYMSNRYVDNRSSFGGQPFHYAPKKLTLPSGKIGDKAISATWFNDIFTYLQPQEIGVITDQYPNYLEAYVGGTSPHRLLGMLPPRGYEEFMLHSSEFPATYYFSRNVPSLPPEVFDPSFEGGFRILDKPRTGSLVLGPDKKFFRVDAKKELFGINNLTTKLIYLHDTAAVADAMFDYLSESAFAGLRAIKFSNENDGSASLTATVQIASDGNVRGNITTLVEPTQLSARREFYTLRYINLLGEVCGWLLNTQNPHAEVIESYLLSEGFTGGKVSKIGLISFSERMYNLIKAEYMSFKPLFQSAAYNIAWIREAKENYGPSIYPKPWENLSELVRQLTALKASDSETTAGDDATIFHKLCLGEEKHFLRMFRGYLSRRGIEIEEERTSVENVKLCLSRKDYDRIQGIDIEIVKDYLRLGLELSEAEVLERLCEALTNYGTKSSSANSEAFLALQNRAQNFDLAMLGCSISLLTAGALAPQEWVQRLSQSGELDLTILPIDNAEALVAQIARTAAESGIPNVKDILARYLPEDVQQEIDVDGIVDVVDDLVDKEREFFENVDLEEFGGLTGGQKALAFGGVLVAAGVGYMLWKSRSKSNPTEITNKGGQP